MTDSVSHTPGPWQAKNEHEWDEIIGNIDGPDAGQFHYTHICSVDMNDLRTPEQHANARLIAAAPELLGALICIADDYADRVDLASGATNPGIIHVIAAARAVIAKATQP